MAEWMVGDVAWGARWDYGDAPQVGFTTVRQVRKDGLLMAARISAFRHCARVDAVLAYKSEREALEGLRRRIVDSLDGARSEVAALERHLADVSTRLDGAAP